MTTPGWAATPSTSTCIWMVAEAVEVSLFPFLLRTVVLVKRPHSSDGLMNSVLRLDVLIWVVITVVKARSVELRMAMSPKKAEALVEGTPPPLDRLSVTVSFAVSAGSSAPHPAATAVSRTTDAIPGVQPRVRDAIMGASFSREPCQCLAQA